MYPRITTHLSFARRFSLLAVSVLAAVVLASPLVAEPHLSAVDSGPIESLPAAESIHLQLDDSNPAQGDTRVAVTYSDAAIARFDAIQGFRDYVVVGAVGRQMMLRDDGRGADDIAGDGVYHTMVWMEHEQLEHKAELDLAAQAAGAQSVAFDNRKKLAVDEGRAFDLEAFQAGEPWSCVAARGWIRPRRSWPVPKSSREPTHSRRMSW